MTVAAAVGETVLAGPLVLALLLALAAGALSFFSPCCLPWSRGTCRTSPGCPARARPIRGSAVRDGGFWSAA